MEEAQALALLITGSCPGGTTSNAAALWLKGDMDLRLGDLFDFLVFFIFELLRASANQLSCMQMTGTLLFYNWKALTTIIIIIECSFRSLHHHLQVQNRVQFCQ